MNPYKPLPSRKSLDVRLVGGRIVLLISIVLTIINIIIAVVSSRMPILYNISVPYYAVVYGKAMDNNFAADGWPINGTYTYIGLAVAAAVLILYVVFLIMTGHHYGWSIALLVCFCLDTVALLGVGLFLLGSTSAIVVDFCIHLWIIYLLSRQVSAAYNLHTLDLVEEYESDEEPEEKIEAPKKYIPEGAYDPDTDTVKTEEDD